MHGYELIERLPEIAGSETHVDVGNLYRVLRALEEEGIVASEWSADLPGPVNRRILCCWHSSTACHVSIWYTRRNLIVVVSFAKSLFNQTARPKLLL